MSKLAKLDWNTLYRRQEKFLKSQLHKYPKDLKTLHLVFCTHLAHEVHEVMDCVPWKFHRKQAPAPRDELVEELVDVLKLYMNLLILHKITASELGQMFDLKSTIVERRESDE